MTKASLILLSLVAVSPGAPARAEPNSAPPADDRFRLSDLLPRPLQQNPRINLSIVTEMTKDGKAIPAPTKDRPAYYIAWDGGLVEEGDVVAGEQPPPPARLAELMCSSLAASGYQPASGRNTPTLVIHYRWGAFNHLSAIGGDDSAPDDDVVLKNLMTRAALVGGVKFSVEFMRAYNSGLLAAMNAFRLRDERTDLLATMALSDLYFIVAVAYDYDGATHGQKKPLWITKISTDSQGLAMDDALPSLVARAGNYFGHETNGSVLFHPRLFPGRVEIGEPTVKDYLDNSPPLEAKAAPAKTP